MCTLKPNLSANVIAGPSRILLDRHRYIVLPFRNSPIVHYAFLPVAPDGVIDVHMGRDTVVAAPYFNATETFVHLLFVP